MVVFIMLLSPPNPVTLARGSVILAVSGEGVSHHTGTPPEKISAVFSVTAPEFARWLR